MALFSDNSSKHTEKGVEVAMDIERSSDDAGRISSSQLEQNERSSLGGGADSRTKLLCVDHKSGNHMLVKLDGKDVKAIMMAPESIRGRLIQYMKHRIDGKSEHLAKSEYLLQDREGELEEYAKFAYLTLGLSYGVLYSLLSASLGRTGNKREVMMSVNILEHPYDVAFLPQFLHPVPSWYLQGHPYHYGRITLHIITFCVCIASTYPLIASVILAQR